MARAGRALVVLLLGGWWGCASRAPALQRATFLTNYVFIGRHAPFFIGLEKGFYRDAGFDLQILPATGSALVITSLEGGQADFGMAEAAPVVQAVSRGARVKAFGVCIDRSTSGLASLDPIDGPRSVPGRRVAASLTDSARVILPIVLAHAGVDPAHVEWQTADPSTYLSLLMTGKADLITASSDSDVPALQRVAEPQGRHVHFASFADWGYDVFGYFLVTQSVRIASHPERVRAFMAATAKAVQYALDHPEEAAQAVSRHSPALDAAAALAQWKQSMRVIQTPYTAEHGWGAATPDRLQRTIDLVARGLKLETAPAADAVFADGFVPR